MFTFTYLVYTSDNIRDDGKSQHINIIVISMHNVGMQKTGIYCKGQVAGFDD